VIYQCYHLNDQLKRCFENKSIYKPFGLEPEVNSNLFLNCPELKDSKVRLHLADFAAMLSLWRNPPQDNWIGFTSWRQTDKSNVIFKSNDEIEKLLETNDVLAWKKYTFDRTLASQAELRHPGITSFMVKMMMDLKEDIPPSYFELKTGFFADYWLMKKETFNSFMNWLFPFMEYGISLINKDPYLLSLPFKGFGYVLERLFVIWYLKNGIEIYDCENKGIYINGVNLCIPSKYKISFGSVKIDDKTKNKVLSCLDTGRIAGGNYIEEFEKTFANKIGSKYAITTCNGTSADAIALKAISIKTGRTNVVVPALTFIAQYNSIIHAGMNPIFADVNEEGLLDDVSKLCEDNNAILFPVHLLGKTCDVSNYSNNIPILEDSCESFGSKIGNKYSGTVGMAGTFSLYVSHSLTSGEGGVIVTDDDEINSLCRSLKNHGRSGSDVFEVFSFPHLGFNGKMSNIHAAVALGCIDKMDDVINYRKNVAKKISYYIDDCFNVISDNIVPHAFPVKYENKSARDKAMRYLDSKGIECRPLFSCLPHEHANDLKDYPNARNISSHYLYVPCHHLLNDCDIKFMCGLIKDTKFSIDY